MKEKNFFGLIFFLCVFVFVVHVFWVGSAIWGDGQYYYAYARSLVIDKDICLENEFNYYNLPIWRTTKGLVANKFPIGSALFWSPLIFLYYFLFKGNGYSLNYQLLVGFINILAGTVGLWFIFETNYKFFKKKMALWSILLVFLSTNLFFYLAVDPINSHPPTFLISSLLIYFLTKIKKNTAGKIYFLFGLLVGILALIRTQELIYGLVISLWILFNYNFKSLFFFITGLLFGFMPQLIVNFLFFGTLRSPYFLFGERFYWLKPKIISALISPNNGLFYSSPILIFSVLGWLISLKKNWLSKFSFLLFLAELYLVSCWSSGWAGVAFGGRMFISLMPIFAFGLGQILVFLKDKRYNLNLLFIFLIALNFYSMIKFLLNQ
jgi:hypothetical protein